MLKLSYGGGVKPAICYHAIILIKGVLIDVSTLNNDTSWMCVIIPC